MKTVLLVDDEFGILDALRDILQDEGYRVLLARHGREALVRVGEVRPDIIFTDLMMPVMDGGSLLHVLRNDTATRDIPVVMMSAVGQERLPSHLAPDDFLPKPFKLDALLAVLERLTGPGASREH
jgi:CheY-like chemotaxis protein